MISDGIVLYGPVATPPTPSTTVLPETTAPETTSDQQQEAVSREVGWYISEYYAFKDERTRGKKEYQSNEFLFFSFTSYFYS